MDEAVVELYAIRTIYTVYPYSVSVVAPKCLVSHLLSFLFLHKLLGAYRDVFRTFQNI